MCYKLIDWILLFPFYSHLELAADDETSNCINYPTVSYETYAHCDREFIRNDLPADLIPFWTVPIDNINMASNKVAWNGSEDEFQFLRKKLGLFYLW